MKGATIIALEAYHYVDRGDELPRQKSPRQDVTFMVKGDAIQLHLPPPAACMLFLTVTPRGLLKILHQAWDDPPREKSERDYKVLDLMEKRGGGFVVALAGAMRHADAQNFARLLGVFPEYWADYQPERWPDKSPESSPEGTT